MLKTKEIIIPIENEDFIEKNKILSSFDAFFSDDFNFDFSDNTIEIQLGALDYSMFQITVEQVLAKNFLNESSKNIVQTILNSITNVKSYGLKSGKRVYVDYNNERKVQHRKEKVEKRQQFYYTKNNDFSQVDNKIPQEFENQIICGDSLDVLKRIIV